MIFNDFQKSPDRSDIFVDAIFFNRKQIIILLQELLAAWRPALNIGLLQMFSVLLILAPE